MPMSNSWFNLCRLEQFVILTLMQFQFHFFKRKKTRRRRRRFFYGYFDKDDKDAIEEDETVHQGEGERVTLNNNYYYL